MSAKDFFTGFFYLPAKAFSGLTDLFLGSYKRDEQGNIKKESKTETNTHPGLIGYVFNAISYVTRAFSNFIYNHKTAIASAFWASLILAGAAALTVFLWPAALTAIVTFPVFGLTIAGLVGAEVAAQIGVIAALTFAATSVASYAIATVANTINWLISCCKPAGGNPDENQKPEQPLEGEGLEGSAVPLKRLNEQGATPCVAKNNAEKQEQLDAELKTKQAAEKKQAEAVNVKLFPKQQDTTVVDEKAKVEQSDTIRASI